MFSSFLLDGQHVQHIYQLLINRLVFLYGRIERYIYNFIVADTNHHIALPIKQCLNTGSAHAAGYDTVVSRGATTAL